MVVAVLLEKMVDDEEELELAGHGGGSAGDEYESVANSGRNTPSTRGSRSRANSDYFGSGRLALGREDSTCRLTRSSTSPDEQVRRSSTSTRTIPAFIVS